ncbi:hypothetical protein EC991_005415 [Linnemannia zychae]|nr:hypothetical protein EC991_005415 [Linnemannia zychae]
MDSSYLTIFCIVDGALLSQAFPVSIHRSQTVGHLKNLIKTEQSPDFDDITANKLTLQGAIIDSDYTSSSTLVVDTLRGHKFRLDDPKLVVELILHRTVNDFYILVQRPPRPSFNVYPPAPEPSQTLSMDPLVKSIEPENKMDESAAVKVLATHGYNVNTSISLFTGWQLVSVSGRADRDGFLLCTSRFNSDMIGHTSNEQRFYDSRRDKYGQGVNSTLMPIMENEMYNIQGAERVWFMGLKKVSVNQKEVVVPTVDVTLQ